MSCNFDIFAVENDSDDCVRWLEAVTTLEQAKDRVCELVNSGYKRFLILDQRTGLRRLIADAAPSSNSMVA